MRILDNSLKIATQLFSSAIKQEQNVFAFMYSGNKLISIGQNNMEKVNAKAYAFGMRFNVDQFKRFPFVHAEVDAISRLWGKYYISGKEKLVVVRFGRGGNIGIAKPCNGCQAILSSLNLNKVFWTTQNDWEQS